MRYAGPECTWHQNAPQHRNPKLEEFERGEQRGREGEEEEEEEGGRVSETQQCVNGSQAWQIGLNFPPVRFQYTSAGVHNHA